MKITMEAGMALRNKQMNYAAIYCAIQSCGRLNISPFAPSLPAYQVQVHYLTFKVNFMSENC